MYLSSQSQIPLTWPILLAPLLVAAVLIFLISVFREPGRRKFSAVFVAGAGAAYLSGGQPAGLEVAMAYGLARRLGVKLPFVRTAATHDGQ
jgi:hypothetical protein